MAGIGFELRKIYEKKTLASSVTGSAYAVMSTIGPAVIFIAVLFGVDRILRWYDSSLVISEFFVSSFTYNFMIALLVSSLLSVVLSRYISDKMFEEKSADISASIPGVFTVSTVLAGICALYFCIRMYIADRVPLSFLFVYYCLCILATHMYTLMGYVSALKEYKKVTYAYLIGFGMGIPFFFLFQYVLKLPIIMGLYCSILISVFIIVCLLLVQCIRAFGRPGKKLFEFLSYFKKYPRLMISGFTYMLGFFISNMIYWNFSDMQVISSIFKTAPSYDVAMFLGIIANLPAVVLFVVKIETEFFEKHIRYLSAINNGNYAMIEKQRESMITTLRLQLFFVYDIQFIITILAISIVGVIFPYIGLSSESVNMFMLLGMGVYATICMKFTTILLYYFEDYGKACITGVVYLAMQLILALVCAKAGPPFYPLPILAAGLTGWILSYYFLRQRMKNLNRYLMCK